MGMLWPSLFVAALAIAAYGLIVLPTHFFYVGFSTLPRPEGAAPPMYIPTPEKDGIRFETIQFVSGDGLCEGWLYLPQSESKNGMAAIAMAHGIASTRDMGLDKFALRFAKEGIAVLLFDYRNFGTSPGEPRNFIRPLSHVEDFRSAAAYLSNRDEIDSQRIGLWGSSYAGGHVLVAAAQDQGENIKAVLSQAPFLGPLPTENKMEEMKRRGFVAVFGGIYGALSGTVRHLLGMDDLYAPVYSYRNDANGFEFSLNYWEDFGERDTTWLQKHPKERNNDWRNGFLLRGLLGMIAYKPIAFVETIPARVKIMYVLATEDKLCPFERVNYAHSHSKKSELVRLKGGHFQIYSGDLFEQSIAKQTAFFNKAL